MSSYAIMADFKLFSGSYKLERRGDIIMIATTNTTVIEGDTLLSIR